MFDKFLSISPRVKIAVLAILHLVGLIGLLSPFQHVFLQLSTANLVISAILILPKKFDNRFGVSLLFIISLGFGIEWMGTTTGWPFGVYSYGNGLSPLLMGVPLVIGVNWWMLTYGALEISRLKIKPKIFQILVAGGLLTALDLLIEQVAPKLTFWTWQSASVPIQNYIAWFVLGTIMAFFIQKFQSKESLNKMAVALFIIQVLFFSILNLAL
ncbi:MAG: carotenoid biosynthesis protein [Flavobacteriales bacterium]|nr:carotenoid biosynthesis protein [Flavobacteriales bacterium]